MVLFKPFHLRPEVADCCICITQKTEEQVQRRISERREGEFSRIEAYVQIKLALPVRSRYIKQELEGATPHPRAVVKGL